MIALVIGGSGSGKSAYAEQMAVKAAGNGSLYYVATMQVYDEEGKKKVERHQKAEAKASDAIAPADTTKNVVYDVTETLPQFPGGQGVMMKYLAANIKYPASAVKAKKQGRVIVTFIIQKDGSVAKARIARSVNPELDAEALRIVKAMPNWTPGTQDGKPVNVKYTIPVVFSLQKDVTPGKKEVK